MNAAMPKVAVLMSTYNGEKFIREQIDSIFSQENIDVELFVRDDGSSDRTVEIIRECEKSHPVSVIEKDGNVGPGLSFFKILSQAYIETDTEYFAFSDQDDIWLPEKLEKAVTCIQEYDPKIPVLYSSNQILYCNGEKGKKRYEKIQSTTLISHITKNTISGCTFVFNRSLAKLVKDSESVDKSILKYRLHDSWVMLVGILNGKVIYDEHPYMLYRIHENNAVGVKKTSLLKRLERIQRFFIKRDDANLRMKTARQLLKFFPDIKSEDRRVLTLFADYQNSFRNKIELMSDREILADCQENPFVFRMKVLLDFV